MSASLHTVLAADTHLANGQILREEPTANKGTSLEFRVGTRMQKVPSKKGQ
jgi:hypothetical protein